MTEKEKAFRRTVWQYYRAHKRDFPWRRTTNPYRILVSECMLQQTQVSRVRSFYPRFLKQFPSPRTLARADTKNILRAWQGLGYNRRALNLQRAAEIITRAHAGKVPKTFEELKALPGIGPGTAGAILAFAYNIPTPFIETNIRRAYIHFFFPTRTHVSDAMLFPMIEHTLDRKNPREWYWALMDYGTYLKQTVGNLSRSSAHYTKQSAFDGSTRQIRGKVLKILGEGSKTQAQLQAAVADERLADVLAALTDEVMITKTGSTYSL